LELLAEMYGPLVLGGLMFLGEAAWLRILIFQATWTERLLDHVIQISAVGAAFWGVAITLLIGMDAKRVVGRLRRTGYYRLVVRYFGESLFASFALMLLSVLITPLSPRLSPLLLSGLWLGTAVWAIATAIRTYVVLTNLLISAAEE
jgi:hypothetical protein